MSPYTKELTLDEVQSLKEKIVKGEIPDIEWMPTNSNVSIKASISALHQIFSTGKLLLTALDYATHILGQEQPPEGYGYAAYSEPKRYKGLHKLDLYLSGWLPDGIDFDGDWNGWHYYAFKLTDLARVEAQTDTEKTEINAKPVTDWEAKYKELEKATTSTLNTSHGQRSFGDYVNGYCKQLDLAERVKELEGKNKELQSKFDELHGYSPKDWKIAELQLKVDGYQDVSKMHLENVFDLHDFYHKIISNLLEQISN